MSLMIFNKNEGYTILIFPINRIYKVIQSPIGFSIRGPND